MFPIHARQLCHVQRDGVNRPPEREAAEGTQWQRRWAVRFNLWLGGICTQLFARGWLLGKGIIEVKPTHMSVIEAVNLRLSIQL
jgi:hypothetical protein